MVEMAAALAVMGVAAIFLPPSPYRLVRIAWRALLCTIIAFLLLLHGLTILEFELAYARWTEARHL